MIGGCLFPANRSDRAFEHDGRADRARALMQGGDLLLDLSFFDGRSIALAQEIEPGRADVAFAPDPGIANIACHRTGAGASESLPRGNSVAVYRRKCYGPIYRPGRAEIGR